MADPVELESLIEQVQGRRRQLIVGGVGTALLAIGTLIGPFAGSVMASMVFSGSAWTGGPLIETGLSEGQMLTMVGLGSLLVSGPLCVAMLFGSWVWHGLVRDEARAAGVDHPALGIAAPARLVAIPAAIGLVLTAFLVPIPFLLPTPDSADILGNAVAGGAILAPLLGPLLALLVAWRRGVDGRATQRFLAGEFRLEDVADGPVSAFPMIARRPRSLVRAELLLEAGRVEDADRLIRIYLETVGVSLHRALLLWARVHRAAGRLDRAEEALAAAARLVPVDASALRELAVIRRDHGHHADAERLDAEVQSLSGGIFGLRRRAVSA